MRTLRSRRVARPGLSYRAALTEPQDSFPDARGLRVEDPATASARALFADMSESFER
jgi:hypothetical protein